MKYLFLVISMALGHALLSQPTVHGPEKGSLLIIGGNVGSTASIWNKFTELAGGRSSADPTSLFTITEVPHLGLSFF